MYREHNHNYGLELVITYITERQIAYGLWDVRRQAI
jgi:hypothetical protein